MPVNYELGLRRQFRYYTRCVAQSPSEVHYHQKRLQIASRFDESEPLQGALADYFFAHWYNLAGEGRLTAEEYSAKLPTHIAEQFLAYINSGEYLPIITTLATRYSVLTVPSMNVPKHKMYVGKDDAKRIADTLKATLMEAKESGDKEKIKTAEDEYLAHCLACQDKMGFMMTWFALAKAGWVFDEKWESCKATLTSGSNDR